MPDSERLNPVLRVAVSADIGAAAASVYRLIADYDYGHRRILPPQFFRNLRVEKGGYGAGTVISVDLASFGRAYHLRGRVTEPDPGHVLAESYDDESVTMFIVDSLGPDRSRVTISSQIRMRSGVIGWVQRMLTRPFLRRVYDAELKLIDDEARRPRMTAVQTTIVGLPRRVVNQAV